MSGLSNEARAKVLQLKKDYILSLPEKVSELEKCLTNNDLDSLRMQSHKIAGSSASYELPDVSFAAKTLEALCKTRIDNNRVAITRIEKDHTLVDAFQVLVNVLNKTIKSNHLV
jgi:HPt (histidine-containing phosphotransfer) domain-containing protein